MRKTVLLLSLFALFALPALADVPAADEAVAGTTAAPAGVLTPLLDAAACTAPAAVAPALPDAGLFALPGTAAGSCPLGGPTCQKGSDCVAYCSDPHAHCDHRTNCCLCPL